MSYSFDFIAATKEVARNNAKKQHMPPLVLALVLDAIDGMQGPEATVIWVKGSGHQATKDSYNVSNHDIKVTPLGTIVKE